MIQYFFSQKKKKAPGGEGGGIFSVAILFGLYYEGPTSSENV